MIRPATLSDLESLLTIYETARQFMRESGNLNQWTGGYPPASLVTQDIQNGNSFVCEEDGQILGVFCYFDGPDPTYDYIEGAWLNDRPYGVIHRIAVAAHRRGVAAACYDWALTRCDDLRIDTHADNRPMQRSLQKYGFTPCGTIYLANGDPRIAYQKSNE
ncbi:MAG: GNAT family N-acetyltransferase [Ruminococcaceae bacterium]|nr:GNAT family N-acetyltransferase [Oscillospiraceae bacterium]